MKKASLVFALLTCLISSPLQAKTFVGVLWPMFGPLPAIGLVELVSELRQMPDVEVKTYLHQEWPDLVEDLNRQPASTRTIVVGYSLGANASAWVANKAHYVDLIIALQPSLLSWNPDVKGGTYGRYIEVYNPNPYETLGGMGSKKLVGPNIEYIANHDSHPGAQFSSQFRDLVRTEVGRHVDPVLVAQAHARPDEVAQVQPLAYAAPQPQRVARMQEPPRALAPPVRVAANALPPVTPLPRSKPKLIAVAANEPPPEPGAQNATGSAPAPRPIQMAMADTAPRPLPHENLTGFIDRLSQSVDSGDLMNKPRLTRASMQDYSSRTYHVRPDLNAPDSVVCSDRQIIDQGGCSGVLTN